MITRWPKLFGLGASRSKVVRAISPRPAIIIFFLCGACEQLFICSHPSCYCSLLTFSGRPKWHVESGSVCFHGGARKPSSGALGTYFTEKPPPSERVNHGGCKQHSLKGHCIGIRPECCCWLYITLWFLARSYCLK